MEIKSVSSQTFSNRSCLESIFPEKSGLCCNEKTSGRENPLCFQWEETVLLSLPEKNKVLPEIEGDNGFNTYGVCDVPAVEERYIIDMPLWDGRFS